MELSAARSPSAMVEVRASLEPTAENVNDLLLAHVVGGHFDPSAVAATLTAYIADVVESATREDWSIITRHLIADVRETLAGGEGGEESAR
jgi:hypothetical protein